MANHRWHTAEASIKLRKVEAERPGLSLPHMRMTGGALHGQVVVPWLTGHVTTTYSLYYSLSSSTH
jgi:hypothetical protein